MQTIEPPPALQMRQDGLGDEVGRAQLSPNRRSKSSIGVEATGWSAKPPTRFATARTRSAPAARTPRARRRRRRSGRPPPSSAPWCPRPLPSDGTTTRQPSATATRRRPRARAAGATGDQRGVPPGHSYAPDHPGPGSSVFPSSHVRAPTHRRAGTRLGPDGARVRAAPSSRSPAADLATGQDRAPRVRDTRLSARDVRRARGARGGRCTPATARRSRSARSAAPSTSRLAELLDGRRATRRRWRPTCAS